MKNVISLTALLLATGIASQGQDIKPTEPTDPPRPHAGQPDGRGNILREIGLSEDQFRQIRRLNMERKPLMETAQRRLREANRSLDEAIYSDSVDENDIQAKVKETQLAQGELIRLRSMNEVAIRRILTPEQLIKFRDLRHRFEMARDNLQTRRSMRQNGEGPNTRPFRDPTQRPRPPVRHLNEQRPRP